MCGSSSATLFDLWFGSFILHSSYCTLAWEAPFAPIFFISHSSIWRSYSVFFALKNVKPCGLSIWIWISGFKFRTTYTYIFFFGALKMIWHVKPKKNETFFLRSLQQRRLQKHVVEIVFLSKHSSVVNCKSYDSNVSKLIQIESKSCNANNVRFFFCWWDWILISGSFFFDMRKKRVFVSEPFQIINRWIFRNRFFFSLTEDIRWDLRSENRTYVRNRFIQYRFIKNNRIACHSINNFVLRVTIWVGLVRFGLDPFKQCMHWPISHFPQRLQWNVQFIWKSNGQ